MTSRRLLNLLTALSLLVFMAVAVLWVRSHFVRDDFEWIRTNMDDTDAVPQPPFLFQHVRTITSARGGIRLDAATLDISDFFFRNGTWPPPGFTRRSNLVVGRYPTVRPEGT